jgi:hypothetical protein
MNKAIVKDVCRMISDDQSFPLLVQLFGRQESRHYSIITISVGRSDEAR